MKNMREDKRLESGLENVPVIGIVVRLYKKFNDWFIRSLGGDSSRPGNVIANSYVCGIDDVRDGISPRNIIVNSSLPPEEESLREEGHKSLHDYKTP